MFEEAFERPLISSSPVSNQSDCYYIEINHRSELSILRVTHSLRTIVNESRCSSAQRATNQEGE
jgi:hypothetical protein